MLTTIYQVFLALAGRPAQGGNEGSFVRADSPPSTTQMSVLCNWPSLCFFAFSARLSPPLPRPGVSKQPTIKPRAWPPYPCYLTLATTWSSHPARLWSCSFPWTEVLRWPCLPPPAQPPRSGPRRCSSFSLDVHFPHKARCLSAVQQPPTGHSIVQSNFPLGFPTGHLKFSFLHLHVFLPSYFTCGALPPALVSTTDIIAHEAFLASTGWPFSISLSSECLPLTSLWLLSIPTPASRCLPNRIVFTTRKDVHCSPICNSPKLETPQMPIEKSAVAYSYGGVQYSSGSE